ncbi:MAG: SDR family NAD(P)-dependent oxidoreductase [Candidatus Aminicenantes bacterium]|jgi:acyl transferase domain-containing protein/acyl carrier protein
MQWENNRLTGLEIAVIGMAVRFPGANNIQEFWDNLKNGVESISFFSAEELETNRVPDEWIKSPDYIKAKGIIKEAEYFDASFFDYSPREAEMMDPQTRICHECAWEALENAGYDPASYNKLIGFYIGANPHYHWDALFSFREFAKPSEFFASFQFYDKDFLSLRISYKLNLKGPSFTLYTACSSSLVAIHLAGNGILSGECDMALAGGASIWLPEKSGYLFEQGMIFSEDGHNRTFDEKATGSVFSDGVGLVVLKRLEEALEDRDNIYAVIKGSAINNDGSRKLGFTAPSVEGLVEVLNTALDMSEVEPESISYFEAHGTATPLGDTVEMEALNKVFYPLKQKSCAIGSVKSNFGHLNSAAGAAGFIKTVLSLKHCLIPPSLHFSQPNPRIDLENSPFYVNTSLKEWKNDKYPLRAGVNSLGIGGTNAHVILEEWPTAQDQRQKARGPESQPGDRLSPTHQSREYQLILLSAKTQFALDKMTKNLAAYFNNDLSNHGKQENPVNPGQTLADAAYTLQLGRRTFQYRRALVCSDIIDASDGLSTSGSQKVKTWSAKDKRRTVVFMFPGVGAQHVNMGRELYEKEPIFGKEMDRCFKLLQSMMEYDIKEILYPGEGMSQVNGASEESSLLSPRSSGDNRSDINQPEIAQVVIFCIEYSLAKLLISWGIRPQHMIGYSLGEYAAACIAGVFNLKDALKLVKTRADLIRQTPEGAMLSVPLPVEQLKSLMDNNDNVSIAIDNGPSTIVSGVNETINAFEKKMKNRKYICMRVDNNRALHAKEMMPILIQFERQVAKVTLNKPQIPYISNVTGEIVNGNDVTHPQYWSKHLRETVQFAEGIKKLTAEPNVVFIEIGPGRDLSALVERCLNKDDGLNQAVIHLMRPKQKKVSEVYYLLGKLGQLWLYNVTIDWANFYSGEERYRIPLPTYPFEAQCFKIEDFPRSTDADSLFKYSPGIRKKNMSQWFYVPSWKRSGLPNLAKEIGPPFQPCGSCLIFVDDMGMGSQLKEQMIKKGQEVITVKPDKTFLKINQHQYMINPCRSDDYHLLLKELQKENQEFGTIVYLWGITGIHETNGESIRDRVHRAVIRGYHALLFLAKAISTQQITRQLHLEVITDHMHEVTGGEGLYPEKTVSLGPCKVIPLEYPNIRCRCIDILFQDSGDGPPEVIVDRLLTEFASISFEPIVAHRGNFRWVQTFDPHPLDKDEERLPLLLKEKDVCLVIGGLGGIGLILAEYMAKRVQARLILTGRSDFPPREQWEQCLTTANGRSTDGVKAKIRKLLELEKHAAGLLVLQADVTDGEQMQEVFEKTEARYGPINGVIHAAGLPDGKMIQLRTEEDSERILASKITGTLVLDRILKEKKPRFFILCSSTGAILPFVGQVSYCSANAFLDAYSLYKFMTGDMVTISINWDRWQNVGFSTIIENQHKSLTGEDLTGGITSREGVEAFTRILNRPVPQVVVFPYDLNEMIQRTGTFTGSSFLDIIDKDSSRGIRHQRPQLATQYIAPETETEKIISRIWSTFFGYEKIGSHDDFFDLGGDSLKAIAIIGKINKDLNSNIPISVLFNRLTIKGIAEYIDQTTGIAPGPSSLLIEPVEKKEYYETTVRQEKFFFLNEMHGLDNALNIFNIITAVGKLDKHRLAECLQMLIRRHESLRTSIHMIDSRILMKINEYDPLNFTIEDIELLGGREDQLHSIKKKFSAPFDLTKPPLIKVALLELEKEKHLILLDIHHLITDDTSMGILVRELSVLYREENPPELKIQYKDYAQWQKKFLASRESKKQENYWLERFAGEVVQLDLPIDYSRPKVRRFQGNWIRFNLEDQLLRKLEQLRKDTSATLYMILLAALTILLSKYTNQMDITIASPVIGREQEELKHIVGLFINLLPMRNFPQPHKSFLDFLNEVKHNALTAYENQLYPLGNLVEKLDLQKDFSRNPLNDVELIMVNTDISALDSEELHFYLEEYDKDKSMVDISLEVTELMDKVSFNLMYCTELFKKKTMERFINSFKEILVTVTENKDILLKDITISADLGEAKMVFQDDKEDFGF